MLNTVDRFVVNARSFAELDLREVGLLASVANAVPNDLAKGTNPGGLFSGHPPNVIR